MIFDRFPGQRGGEEERGRLIPGRGPSRCGGMNYIERRWRKSFQAATRERTRVEAARLKLRPLIDGG